PAEHRDRGHARPEGRGGAGRVERLAARDLVHRQRALDAAQLPDLVRDVERRAEGEGRDHRASSRSRSARVACRPVPPEPSVDSDPATVAQRTRTCSSSTPQATAARYPASKLSPAPVVSTTSTATPGARTTTPSPPTDHPPSAPSLTTTRGPRRASRTASSVSSRSAGSPSAPAIARSSLRLGRSRASSPLTSAD